MEFIFWFVVILLILRFVVKFFLPWYLNRKMKKFQDRFEQEQQYHKNQYRKEGDVNIDYVPPQNEEKEFDDSEAEVVDFEEIKDE